MKHILKIFTLLLIFQSSCSASIIQTNVSDPAMVRIPANHPMIRYTGRIDFSDVLKPSFTFPGVSVKAKFEGNAIDILLKDLPKSPHANYFTILVDEKVHAVIRLGTDTVYKIVRGLSKGVHTVEICKRTESMVGKCEFLGFQLPKGRKLLELPAPVRKMEFIGNSITCGYGNEGKDQFQPFADSTENNYMSYGAITARNLNAQYLAVAYSGKGVYRNFGGSTEDPIPAVYDRIFPDSPLPGWNFSNYIPDIVVINLGTNDFYAEGTDSALFVSAYKNLLTRIRTNYPSAKIFCITGPMMSDHHPPGEKALTTIKKYLTYLVKDFNSRGDEHFYFFSMSPQGAFGMGSDYHPNIEQHVFNAEELTKFIRSKTGW